MISFIILILGILLLATGVVFALTIKGIAFLFVYGDILVCMILIIIIVKHLINKKR